MTRRRSSRLEKHLVALGLVVGLGFASAHSQEWTKAQDGTQDARAALRAAPLDAPKSPLAAVARQDNPGVNISSNATGRPVGGNPLWQVPLSSLSATRERPIFSPSRRPPPIVNSPIEASKPLVVAGPERPPLVLVGAIAGNDDGIAILLDQTTKVITRVKTGDSHAGWVLRTVKGREAMLEKDHQTTILTLPNAPGE
jgi:hypothetical protein